MGVGRCRPPQEPASSLGDGANSTPSTAEASCSSRLRPSPHRDPPQRVPDPVARDAAAFIAGGKEPSPW